MAHRWIESKLALKILHFFTTKSYSLLIARFCGRFPYNSHTVEADGAPLLTLLHS